MNAAAPQNLPPDDAWRRFEDLARKAQAAPTPRVDVVAPVLDQIARQRPSAWLPRQGLLISAAVGSAVVAASLVLAVWTASQSMTDPAAGWFQPFEVALLERP